MLSLIRAVVRIYQITISPVLCWMMGPGAGCRFEPTCSEYFLEAVETQGVFRGTWSGLKRIARCQPWGGYGNDPVPSQIGRSHAAARPICE
jgi:putative membrane protein insertion efficiency factor